MNAVTQEFCVRWNSHLGSIGAAFPQLLAGQRFVDVTLACEGHQLHCHRLVLAACSTYFEAILAENPCKHPVIILPGEIKLWEIQALVDFMYKGEVNVTQAGLGQLLRCAEQLRIRGLYGSEAAINYNQLQQMRKETVMDVAPVITRLNNIDVNVTETEDAATNSTASITASTTQAQTAKQHQHQQEQLALQQQHKELRQRQQANGGNTLQLQKPHKHHPQQSLNTASSATASNNSNVPTEDESADDASNIWNTYNDHCDDYSLSATAEKNKTQTFLLQTRSQPPIQLQSQNLDTTIEDDHNYVAAHEADNESSVARIASSGSGLSLSFDSDTPANISAGIMHSSIDSYTSYKRVRRSEASLAQAAKCVSKGETFQTVSNMFNIPVSTIRFYMARKGILPKRKRGRGASHAGNSFTTANAGTLSTQNSGTAHHLSQNMPLDTVLKSGISNASGSNSPEAVTATLNLPSPDIGTTAAGMPFHHLSDASTFKLSEQHQLNMI
ncbi:broad-complex core protein isoforms 1/2/3/4/5 isoform X1 [Drosophila guanche]|uniref:Blast:Protein bric-a-brac 1 n=1 Tax=Drosophila guanche TaxID=7266 RepID=A0A3B0KKV1_DROGU|nr:broad-complex core protein isoforms 1/2/3/4/5 isoform X1 [Drosophila guanche]SPP86426.1 blast:Protein bric-a-brac 1 [Drosophila guanche]